MHSQKLKLSASISVAFFASCAFLLYDTHAYRSAMHELTEPAFVDYLHKVRADTESDIHNYQDCKVFKNKDTQTYSDDARQCILDAMPKTKTISGIALFSVVAEIWLNNHDSDNEIKAAALQMIDNGWGIIGVSKKLTNDPLQRLNAGWNQSFILSMLGKNNEKDMSEVQADILETAEYRIISPNTLHKQAERRAALFQ